MKRANCTLCTLTLMARKCFSNIKKSHKLLLESGGSPGLVVMGGHSCSKGYEFESLALYTGWTFFHIYLL